MLPAFLTSDLYCKVQNFKHAGHHNRMPRVVPDQREKFENDELFRKLSRVAEVCKAGNKVFIVQIIHACVSFLGIYVYILVVTMTLDLM